MGSPPDVSVGIAAHNPCTTRRCCRSRATETLNPREDIMAASIKVGVIADETGPLEFAGLANANVARMVVGDINAKGGLLGRQLELIIEDGATDDAVAASAARKLVEQDQVDVIL